MLFAPIVFYIISKGKWWLALAGMIGVWLFRGQSFSLAWQLIFNLGILAGFYWQDIEVRFRKLRASQRRKIKRGFAATAGLTFAASYASVFGLSLLNGLWGDGALPQWLQHVTFTWDRLNYDVWVYADKWRMGPLRVILFAIWFPVLYWLVRKYEKRLVSYSRGVLELLGRNSLFVYIAHSFIVFTFKLYLIPASPNILQNFLITGAGVALLIAITKLYKQAEPTFKNIAISALKLKRASP
jgi:hypothetical protein